MNVKQCEQLYNETGAKQMLSRMRALHILSTGESLSVRIMKNHTNVIAAVQSRVNLGATEWQIKL